MFVFSQIAGVPQINVVTHETPAWNKPLNQRQAPETAHTRFPYKAGQPDQTIFPLYKSYHIRSEVRIRLEDISANAASCLSY